MIEYIIWSLTFLGLWTALFWINYLYFKDEEKNKLNRLPTVSISIPAYNEEKTIEKTVSSLVKLDYPKEKIEILVVNDGSKDNTKKIVKELIKKYPQSNIKLINKVNEGKAIALNAALSVAKGKLFACVDADSRVDKNALKAIVPSFEDPKTGVVVSAIKVEQYKNLYERIQKVEYILMNLARKLLSRLNTLAIAHGALSVFNTRILRKIGGFSKYNGLTEDLEVAMRLRYNGYKSKMDWDALSYTLVPNNFKMLWRQRIRWYRGYIYNHLKFKDMFFNKKHALYGIFQMPLNVITVLTMLLTIGVVGYGFINDAWEFMVRTLTIKGYLLNHFLDFPALKELVLGRQIHIYFPIILLALVGAYVVIVAHKQIKERVLKHLHIIFIYFLAFPYLTAVHWISAIIQEILNHERKWR